MKLLSASRRIGGYAAESVPAQRVSTAEVSESAPKLQAALVAQLGSVSQELQAARALSSALHDQLVAVGLELADARKINEPLQAQLAAVGQELEIQRRQNLALEAMLDGGQQPYRDAPSANGRPSILFNALPKSASTYCFETLRQAGDYHEGTVSAALFPYDVLAWRRYSKFAIGGQIAHHHLEASPVNLWQLRRWPVRLIVHVRDPRQALLSWLHHNTRSGERESPPLTVASPPDAWFDLPQSEQLDWFIEHHLPLFVEWIEGWIDAVDAGKIEALFTTFEDMVRDPAAFFDTVSRYCGLEGVGPIRRPDPKETSLFQFRAGRIDEWREIYTSAQIERVAQGVPRRILQRFGWQE